MKSIELNVNGMRYQLARTVKGYRFEHLKKAFEIEEHRDDRGVIKKYTCRVAGNRSKVSTDYWRLDGLICDIVGQTIQFN